jgi:hypothetical protein
MKEIWKDVAGYEDRYQISDQGNARKYLKDGKFLTLKPGITTPKNGYLFVQFAGPHPVDGNPSGAYTIHRLVALAFIPNPENKPCVNHIDGNKYHNWVSNLEWVTYSENMKKSYATGIRYVTEAQCSGPTHPNSANSVKKTSMPVKCLETGQTFFSISEACRQLHINGSYLNFCMKNGLPAKGYTIVKIPKEE